jgi:heme/copper-type cytochrome/quinol oxidase subunit 1
MQRSRLSFLRIRQKPFELFGLFALFFLLISFIPFKQQLDVNLHDSYFVFSIQSIFIICTIYFLLIWSMYLLTNRLLFSVRLIWIHFLITILPAIILIIISMIKLPLEGVPRRYYSFDEFEKTKPVFNFYVIYSGTAITMLLGQLLLPINILGGLIKRLIS